MDEVDLGAHPRLLDLQPGAAQCAHCLRSRNVRARRWSGVGGCNRARTSACALPAQGRVPHSQPFLPILRSFARSLSLPSLASTSLARLLSPPTLPPSLAPSLLPSAFLPSLSCVPHLSPCLPPCLAASPNHIHWKTHTHTHMHARAHPPTHTHTHPRPHTHTHTLTRSSVRRRSRPAPRALSPSRAAACEGVAEARHAPYCEIICTPHSGYQYPLLRLFVPLTVLTSTPDCAYQYPYCDYSHPLL
jgi:hypothetical protein